MKGRSEGKAHVWIPWKVHSYDFRGESMKTIRFLPAWTILAGLAAGVPAAKAAVYVDVETDAGTFTIEMDEGARNGGAAFLGLAAGWVDWVDPRNGKPRQGERYFEGTEMGWVQKDEGGDALLVGNLGRWFTGADGGKNRNNGAGWAWRDDIAGPTGLTARSVAMVQQNGPHSIDGCFAVFLKDADAYYGGRWSRIGTVASNWGVVEAMAGRAVDGSGWMESPAEVTGIRIHGDEGEIAAWRAAAASNAPCCGMGEAGLGFAGGEATLTCRMEGKGRYAIAHTTNLTDEAWIVNWMNWNEGEGALEETLPFSTATNAMGKQRHFAVVAAEYPELGGPTVTGKYSFRVEWEAGDGEENQVYQYDLDVGAGTGMAWRLDAATQSEVLESAELNQIMVGRSGAHSTGVSFVVPEWWHVPYYWLGEAPGDEGHGRFRMWEAVSGGEVWGTWRGQDVP